MTAFCPRSRSLVNALYLWEYIWLKCSCLVQHLSLQNLYSAILYYVPSGLISLFCYSLPVNEYIILTMYRPHTDRSTCSLLPIVFVQGFKPCSLIFPLSSLTASGANPAFNTPPCPTPAPAPNPFLSLPIQTSIPVLFSLSGTVPVFQPLTVLCSLNQIPVMYWSSYWAMRVGRTVEMALALRCFHPVKLS